MLADARQIAPGDEAEGNDPKDYRHCQPPVEPTDQKQRGDAVDRHEPDDLNETFNEIACRLPRLPDLGGNAPGKIILEEGIGLAENIGVRLPADHIVETRRQGLVFQQRVDRRHDEADYKDGYAHEQKFWPCRLQKRRPASFDATLPRLIENIDQPAGEIEQARLDQRQQSANRKRNGERPFRLPRIMPEKAERG